MFSESCLGGSSFSSVNQGVIRLSRVNLCFLGLGHLQHLPKILAECEAASGLVFETEIWGKPRRWGKGRARPELPPGFSCYGHWPPRTGWACRPFGPVGWDEVGIGMSLLTPRIHEDENSSRVPAFKYCV